MKKHSTANTQHSTPNEPAAEVWEFNEGNGDKRKFDLEDRLLEFASAIIDLSEKLPATRAGNHVAGQILRSGTAPYPNHGEAEAAESRDDFIHKLKICLRACLKIPVRNTELGSSVNPQPGWLRYIGGAGFQPAGSGGILPPVYHFQTASLLLLLHGSGLGNCEVNSPQGEGRKAGRAGASESTWLQAG
jgi:hypothetical protein